MCHSAYSLCDYSAIYAILQHDLQTILFKKLARWNHAFLYSEFNAKSGVQTGWETTKNAWPASPPPRLQTREYTWLENPPSSRAFRGEGIFSPACWGWGESPPPFNSIYPSPARLARYSYLYYPILPLSPLLSGICPPIHIFIYRRPTLYPLEIAVDFLKSL